MVVVAAPGHADDLDQLRELRSAMPARQVGGGVAAPDQRPAVAGMIAQQAADQVEGVAAIVGGLIVAQADEGSGAKAVRQSSQR